MGKHKDDVYLKLHLLLRGFLSVLATLNVTKRGFKSADKKQKDNKKTPHRYMARSCFTRRDGTLIIPIVAQAKSCARRAVICAVF